MQVFMVVGSTWKFPLHWRQNPRVGCLAMQVGTKESLDDMMIL